MREGHPILTRHDPCGLFSIAKLGANAILAVSLAAARAGAAEKVILRSIYPINPQI